MTTYEVLTLVIGGATAVIGLYNVYALVASFREDHKRRRQQATIEYVSALWRQARLELDERFGFKPLQQADVDAIRADPSVEARVRNTLGTLEHLAVGMHAGVYDKDLLYRMSATYTINIVNRFRLFVEHVRREVSANAYTELERLAVEFEERKKASGQLPPDASVAIGKPTTAADPGRRPGAV